MRMVFASFLMGMTPKDPSQLRPEFLALWLKIHNVHEAFSKTSQHTSGLGNFSWSAVKRLPVRFPKNSGEQIAITRLMSLVDRYIAMTSARGLFLRDISAPMKATENDENSDPDSGLADEATETEDIERVEALPHDAELARIIRKGSDFGSQDGVIVSRTKDRTLPLSSAGHVGRKIGRMARCERPAGQLRRGRSREAR